MPWFQAPTPPHPWSDFLKPLFTHTHTHTWSWISSPPPPAQSFLPIYPHNPWFQAFLPHKQSLKPFQTTILDFKASSIQSLIFKLLTQSLISGPPHVILDFKPPPPPPWFQASPSPSSQKYFGLCSYLKGGSQKSPNNSLAKIKEVTGKKILTSPSQTLKHHQMFRLRHRGYQSVNKTPKWLSKHLPVKIIQSLTPRAKNFLPLRWIQ